MIVLHRIWPHCSGRQPSRLQSQTYPIIAAVMKFLVLALLTVSSLANAAQWTPLGENNFGAFYVDKASITQSQDLIQVDTLLNWVEPHTLLGNDTKTYQSEVALAYLNCKNSELAFGSRTMYADSNGMGHVVFNIDL